MTIMTSIDESLRTGIRVMNWKQWKKKSKRLWELLRLEVPKWIAKEYQGAYQLVAQKSVLKGAISKRI